MLASNALIQVTPGLMIWTIVAFFITFFVLRKWAFGPIQKMIDERRDQIRRSIEEADNARKEARELLEDTLLYTRAEGERLNALYGERHRFAVLNSHPGVRIEIGLPLERAEAPTPERLKTPPPARAGTRVA